MGQWIEIVLGFIFWPFIAYFLGREASRKNRIVYYIYAVAMFLYTVVLACIDIQGWWLDFLRNGALSFTLVVLIRFAYQGGKTESKLLVGWGGSTFMMMDENIVQFYGKDGVADLERQEATLRAKNEEKAPEERESEEQLQARINQFLCEDENCFYFERHNYKWKGALRLGVYYNPSVI